MKRKYLIFILIALALALTGLAMSGKQRIKFKDPKMQGKKTPPEEQPTIITRGVKSEREKEHGKLFGRHSDSDITLPEKAEIQDKVSVEIGIGRNRSPANFTINSYLEELSCRSDAIIIGAPKSRNSQLTEDERFIFTEYEISIESIIKNNNHNAFEEKEKIIIVRAGGSIQINNKIIRAVEHAQKPLHLDGRYLFFIKYIEKTKAYQSVEEIWEDTFWLVGTKVMQTSKSAIPLGANRAVDAADFLEQARQISNNSDCKEGRHR